jgi:prefoldin subunit 5
MGLNLSSSSSNTLYGNQLANNNGASSVYSASHIQAYDDGTNNWNSSSYGNYWSDWTSPDTNGDGIVDSPYAIVGGSNVDAYPLIIVDVNIISPADGTIVHTPTVLVTGMASTGKLVINGVLVHVEDDGTFSVVLSLVEGDNTIMARSLNPISEASASVVVTYVSEIPTLEEEIEELQTNGSELQTEIDSLTEQLEQTSSQLNESRALLNATRAWLSGVENQLVTCYDAQNATADEVASMLAQVQSMKASMIELRSSLNATDANVTALVDEIDSVIAELTSTETKLTAAQNDLKTTQSDVSSLKSDSLPLMLGGAGLVLGIGALALIGLLFTRKK